ncbi:MAG: hypothetical protein WDZ51_09480 [Pirellulaceae bacterium]
MRYLEKPEAPPESIRQFLEAQRPVGLNLDYKSGFTRKAELLQELIAQQFGLCAYTGMPVDPDRLESLNTDQTRARGIEYRAHNEHIKAQSVCRSEAEERGEEWGTVVAEDMDHRNIVAAVETRGASSEQFGATVRGNNPIPLPPTDPRCEVEFRYLMNGIAEGTSQESRETIEVLRLNHRTLSDSRASWLDVFFRPTVGKRVKISKELFA